MGEAKRGAEESEQRVEEVMSTALIIDFQHCNALHAVGGAEADAGGAAAGPGGDQGGAQREQNPVHRNRAGHQPEQHEEPDGDRGQPGREGRSDLRPDLTAQTEVS